MALPTLYELSEEYVALARDIVEAEGELTPELMERWTQLTGDIATKTQNTALVLRNYELASVTIDTEIKRLQALKKTADNAQNRMKDYLIRCLASAGIKSVPCATMQVTVADTGGAVEITNEEAVPPAYKKAEVSMPMEVWLRLQPKLSVKDRVRVTAKCSSSKSLIHEALKAGTEVAGAHMVYNKSLRIK